MEVDETALPLCLSQNEGLNDVNTANHFESQETSEKILEEQLEDQSPQSVANVDSEENEEPLGESMEIDSEKGEANNYTSAEELDKLSAPRKAVDNTDTTPDVVNLTGKDKVDNTQNTSPREDEPEVRELDDDEFKIRNAPKKRGKRFLIDSDSDSENINENAEVEKQTENTQQSMGDNEDEEQDNTENIDNKFQRKLKRLGIIDSDSEEDETISPNNEISNQDTTIYNINRRGELTVENSDTLKRKSTIPNLYDSESSDEERNAYNGDEENEDPLEEPLIEAKTYKRKSKKDKSGESSKEMTGRDAAQLRKEIRSESQRMLRESNVSLPYHIPKSYSLKEFLEKRSKLKPILPQKTNAPPAVAIKMPKEQLEIVSMQLEERMKEVEKFYKSESDSDDGEYVANEFRGWLNSLLDRAFDIVEKKDVDPIETIADKYIEQKEDAEKNEELIEETVTKPQSKYELLKARLLNIRPRLSGAPDEVIDLDEGVSRPNEVKKLVERYIEHNRKQVHHKREVEVNIVSVSGGGEIHNEKVAMHVDDDDESNSILETPGAKLQKLRTELQNQIAQKRNELWKHKQQLQNEEEEIKDDYEDGYLDDEEEEFDITDASEEEYLDEDEEENDVVIEDKPREKSKYLDEEAEESDMDAGDENEECQNNDQVTDNEQEYEQNEDMQDDEKEIEENQENEKTKHKSLKRILKAFTEDSDEDEDQNPATRTVKENVKSAEEKDRFDISTTSFDGENLPPNRTAKTQQHPDENSDSEMEFLTPVTYLTGLQNIATDPRLRDGPSISPFKMPSQASSSLPTWSPKRLFNDCSESTQHSQTDSQETLSSSEDTQVNSQVTASLPESGTNAFGGSQMPTTQDLVELCSGKFTGITGVTQIRPETQSEEMKNLDEEQDNIISQLLDESEFETFRKKFESPKVDLQPKDTEHFEEIGEVTASGLIDSDDEGLQIKKKSNHKKLVFSDDEDVEETEENQDTEEEEEGDGGEIDYDSEENEVEQRGEKIKINDFVEKEAELSESEWGSEDEDEKGLDELEFELGDTEKFDEDKVREDLERIHMRQLLDEDNREVKLLQELYLEDGELHGTGRQRQFRWKNIDSFGGEENREKEDEVYLDEEESEEQWRKQRHQREMFLKSQSQSSVILEDDLEILSGSKVFKIGHKAIQKAVTRTTAVEEAVDMLVTKQPFDFMAKRGSFLNKGKEVLQRLAEFTKKESTTTTTTTVHGTKKTSRNFLFQTTEKSKTLMENNKRKAEDGTPNAIKKLRLTTFNSPVGDRRKSEKPEGAKKLF